jgi:hypothetical protein
MIRGGMSLGRIARLLACAFAALAAAVPATVSAQSPAVDEYTLDIPGGGGSQPDDPGSPPPTGVEASGSGGGGGATGDGSAGGGATGDRSAGGGAAAGGDEDAAGRGESQGASGGEGLRYDNLHDDVAGTDSSGGGTTGPLDTSSRSAPEVVADSLTDGGMLPLIAALAVITGLGVWRVLRHRRTLTRASG